MCQRRGEQRPPGLGEVEEPDERHRDGQERDRSHEYSDLGRLLPLNQIGRLVSSDGVVFRSYADEADQTRQPELLHQCQQDRATREREAEPVPARAQSATRPDRDPGR